MISNDLNRVISSIATEQPIHILERLEEWARSGRLERSLAKAASHGLCPSLTDFTIEQLIRLIHLYIQADSTTPKVFSCILEEFGNKIYLVSSQEFFSLCTVCDSLDSHKTKRPPNQVIVQFLMELQALLFQQLKEDGNLLMAVSSNPIPSITLIEMLLKLNIPIKKLIAPFFHQAKSQLIEHYRSDEGLALHALIFYSRLLSKKLTFSRGSFYRDSFYRSTVANIQGMAKQIALRDLCRLVESCALAHIRDLSLFRTVARTVCSQGGILDNLHLLIGLLDSYSKLNVPDLRILDLVFDRVVTRQMRPETSQDQLTVLHAAALCGASGAAKVKVYQIVANLSPHMLTPTNASALLKLELIRLFCSIRFPRLTHHFPIVQITHELGTISKPQRKVSDFLTKHGIEHVCEAMIECYPYPVDIVIPFFNVVIEVDGPQHFDISGRALLGKDELKNALISSQWRLIRIPAGKVNTHRLQIILGLITSDINRLTYVGRGG